MLAGLVKREGVDGWDGKCRRQGQLRRTVWCSRREHPEASLTITTRRPDERFPAGVEVHMGNDPAEFKALKTLQAALEPHARREHHFTLPLRTTRDLFTDCRLAGCPKAFLVLRAGAQGGAERSTVR